MSNKPICDMNYHQMPNKRNCDINCHQMSNKLICDINYHQMSNEPNCDVSCLPMSNKLSETSPVIRCQTILTATSTQHQMSYTTFHIHSPPDVILQTSVRRSMAHLLALWKFAIIIWSDSMEDSCEAHYVCCWFIRSSSGSIRIPSCFMSDLVLIKGKPVEVIHSVRKSYSWSAQC